MAGDKDGGNVATGRGKGSPVRVGLLGCGNVGEALARVISTQADLIAFRTGVRLELGGIAVRDLGKMRAKEIDESLFSTDAKALAERDDIDIVVELIGGIDPSKALIEAAIKAHHFVVTGNKALLSSHLAELSDLAVSHGVDLLYEAAAAGAIPVVRPLRESLAGEHVVRLMGIVNGTTNYILTEMSDRGLDYESALRGAQALGLAERDPKADVEGHDAAAKAAILASLSFGCSITGNEVHREGITGIRSVDVEFAQRLGYEVKLLAIAERLRGDTEISVRVHPTMVPKNHPLASVRGAFNAVFVEGATCGELMFYGQGAGGVPTASAVLGDLIDAARNLGAGAPTPAPKRAPVSLRPLGELRSAFYICLDVMDRPAVLAAVAAVFGNHEVSIRVMEQVGLGPEARLIFLTHSANEGDVQATLLELGQLDVVDKVGAVIRVIGPDEEEGGG